MNGSTTDFNGNIVINGSRAITLEENCPLDVCPSPGQLSPSIIAPEENCPRRKFPPHHIVLPLLKQIPTKEYHRWTEENSALSIIYEYHNIRVLQLRSKKWFASIYFLQILNKLCRTPLIREHLSLNASWFSYARTQKENTIFWKNWFEKKKQKNFIVNNNKKIIRAWYLRQAPG